jgi:hypothetical protein
VKRIVRERARAGKTDIRRVTRLLILAAVGIGSFAFTLWATAPRTTSSGADDFRSDAERLASYSISSTSDLVEAVISLGFSDRNKWPPISMG